MSAVVQRLRANVSLTLGTLAAILAVAAVIGGVAGVNLPFGAKAMTVQRGYAALMVSGDGTFQADDGGVSAYLPAEVLWIDKSGHDQGPGRPACLRPNADGFAGANVEAGYVMMRTPGGSESPVVGWVRCL